MATSRQFFGEYEGQQMMLVEGESGRQLITDKVSDECLAELNRLNGNQPKDFELAVGASMFGWNTPMAAKISSPELVAINEPFEYHTTVTHDQVIEALYAPDAYDAVTDTHTIRDTLPLWLRSELIRLNQEFTERDTDCLRLTWSTERAVPEPHGCSTFDSAGRCVQCGEAA